MSNTSSPHSEHSEPCCYPKASEPLSILVYSQPDLTLNHHPSSALFLDIAERFEFEAVKAEPRLKFTRTRVVVHIRPVCGERGIEDRGTEIPDRT